MTLVLGIGFAAAMVLELCTSSLPFVLPDVPLGTYAQMTQLALLVSVAQCGLMALGSALAFRRPALGGLLLVSLNLAMVAPDVVVPATARPDRREPRRRVTAAWQ